MDERIENALYIVATPIGNLGDFTYRAVHILKNVDLIAAEDTRTSSVLLKHYGIGTSVRSYHSHNISHETPRLVQQLKQGASIALISDAGTPGISDPGYHLVKACVEEGIRVIPVPGAAAFVAALVSSGLATHSFVFEGFLPIKKGRQTKIKALAEESRTIVFYESPHRIAKTARQLCEAWGDRRCVLAREITKKFEELRYTTLQQLAEELEQQKAKGEMVLIIEGYSKK